MSGKRPRTIDEAEDDRCFGPLPQEDILREDLRAITAERDSLKAELERKSERLTKVERIICNLTSEAKELGGQCAECRPSTHLQCTECNMGEAHDYVAQMRTKPHG